MAKVYFDFIAKFAQNRKKNNLQLIRIVNGGLLSEIFIQEFKERFPEDKTNVSVNNIDDSH